MLAEQYVQLFDELGIYDHRGVPNGGRILKHQRANLPALYFNRNKDVGVYFVGKLCDQQQFPEHLWARIPDNLVKGRDRQSADLLPIVPIEGMERRAFESLTISLD